MNIENISRLAEQINKLGFQDCSSSLLKQICFRPASITIKQKLQKDETEFLFMIYLERNVQEEKYCLKYYDCSIQSETETKHPIIDGIDTAMLAGNMGGIDWKQAFDLDAPLKWSVADKTSWETASKIEAIIESLAKLEQSASGKAYANQLKQKYWTGNSSPVMVQSKTKTKWKPEISQRFYCATGIPEISVGEACRYLQNKLLEKQLLGSKKMIKKADKCIAEPGHRANGHGSSLKKQRKIAKETIHSKTLPNLD